ncbi:lysoplasmalogenase [Clostridium cibarium]
MLILLFPLMHYNITPTGYYEEIFKTLCSICFVCCSFFSFRKCPTNKKYFSLMFIGLIFCLFGDIFLSFPGETVFISGVGSFAIGHIFFILGFIYLTSISLKDLIMYFILITLAVSFITSKSGFHFQGMLPLVLIYTSIILFMLTKSFSLLKLRKGNKLGTYLTISGTTLFFISDFILLFVIYYTECPHIFSAINLFVYYIGQGLLSLSFIGDFKSK